MPSHAPSDQSRVSDRGRRNLAAGHRRSVVWSLAGERCSMNAYFSPGDQVNHASYGRGIVRSAHDSRVEVHFDAIGQTKHIGEGWLFKEGVRSHPVSEFGPVDLWGHFEPPSLPHGLLPEVIEEFACIQGTLMGSDPGGLAAAALAVC